MKRYLLFLLCVFCSVVGVGAETLMLEPGTPVFEKPKLPPKVIALVTTPTSLPVIGSKLILVRKHPLARYYRLTEVRLPDGRTGYCHPGIMMNRQGNLEFGSVVEWWRGPLPALFGGILAALCVILWYRRGEKDRWRWLEIGLLPVCLHMLLLVLLVNAAQNIITNPADETGYYSNLVHFLAGDFSQRWHFTVGTSIFYLPFELLSGTRHLSDIMVPVSWVEGFLVAPLAFFLGYLIGRKLTKSDWNACVAMLCWTVLPFVWHHRPDFAGKWFYAFFDFPCWEFSYRHYINLIGCGFTAMSDAPSTMLVLLTMVILLYRRAGWYTAALAAFVFGVACMFRINNILFIPVLGVVCLLRQPEYFAGVRRTFGNIAAGAGAFLIGFLPQMLVNWKFFGSPLKFSYTNYAAGSNTYVNWVFVQLNSAFYGAVNQVVWIPAILSFFFMKDRKLRIILAFWAVPVIWFFFGYSHGCDDPVRFILSSYPALFLAIAANGLWEKMKRIDLVWMLLLLVGLILCIPNPISGSYAYYLNNPLHLLWRTKGFLPIQLIGVGAMVVATVMLFRRDRRLGLFIALGCVFYTLGNAYWLALGLAAVFLYALYDAVILLMQTWRANRDSRGRNASASPTDPSSRRS